MVYRNTDSCPLKSHARDAGEYNRIPKLHKLPYRVSCKILAKQLNCATASNVKQLFGNNVSILSGSMQGMAAVFSDIPLNARQPMADVLLRYLKKSASVINTPGKPDI